METEAEVLLTEAEHQIKRLQTIIDTLVPFIIAFVEPHELVLELCEIADGTREPEPGMAARWIQRVTTPAAAR